MSKKNESDPKRTIKLLLFIILKHLYFYLNLGNVLSLTTQLRVSTASLILPIFIGRNFVETSIFLQYLMRLNFQIRENLKE